MVFRMCRERQVIDPQCEVNCVEKITVSSLLLGIIPFFFRKNFGKKQIFPGGKSESQVMVYYVDASYPGLAFAKFISKFINVKLEKLDFSFFYEWDKTNNALWWDVMYEDSNEIQKYLKGHDEFQKIIRLYQAEEKLIQFLSRRLLVFNNSPFVLIRILFLMRLVSQKCRLNEGCRVNMFFLSSQRPWLSEVGNWAKKRNINIIPINGGKKFKIKNLILRFDRMKFFVKKIMYYGMSIKYQIRKKRDSRSIETINSFCKKKRNGVDLSPKLAVEFYGHLNSTSPQLHSDIFFCQQSKIFTEDVLVYFKHSGCPLTDKKWGEIKKYGMMAVAINPNATTTPHGPIFDYYPQKTKVNYSKKGSHDKKAFFIRKDLYQQISDYKTQLDYWMNFVRRYNIKIHVSWYKHEAGCFPIADALQKTGGVGIIYQRSFEHMSNPWMVSSTDVVFGFSRQAAHLMEDHDSRIPYYVVTGYLGDHRFALVKEKAMSIRTQLRSCGAERVVTYFDENSEDDQRWGLGNNVTQENHEFLFNKILENPKLGLVLKPKIPKTLRSRLGSISKLLQQAQETGRCLIFDEGDFCGAYPPAAAALAADVAIHGHFFAGTAGIESALTGTPTLMLDKEQCLKIPLYKLGKDKVIFQSWDNLWKACQDHWNSPDKISGFGDWAPVIDDLDPFRDGRAAERMETYLQWLMEGFKAKLPRETILADAAERYTKIWGKDKIFSVNCNSEIMN